MTGAVGTTPRKSLVWNRASARFTDFVAVIQEALIDVEETIREQRGVAMPYPVLAAEVDDLAAVHSAYEVYCVGPEELPAVPDTAEERLDAAMLLDQALLEVVGDAASPSFTIRVGLAGTVAGELGCTVRRVRNSVSLRFGVVGTPGDSETTRRIREALDLNHDLVSIYYESGHSIQGGGIYGEQIRDVPFPKWAFEDFDGFDVMSEKPAKEHARIHELVGGATDRSLFGWVAKTCRTGWLTCDDGAEEIADFVHFVPGMRLSLIHVKAAKSDSVQRHVSASAYEVVVGQATKNVGFLRPTMLAQRLSAPATVARATWLDGVRQADRMPMAAALENAGRIDFEVVVLQPHLRQARYESLTSGAIADAADLLRLNRLETLLNAGRGAVTGLGAELRVIGAK